MSNEGPPRVTLSVDRAEDLLARMYPNGQLGGLMLDGLAPASAGELIELVVTIKEPAPRTLGLKLQVAWARRKGTDDLRTCFGAQFLAEDPGSRDRLIAFAHGTLDPAKSRLSPRAAVGWPATLTVEGEERKEALIDLSLGGAFIRSYQLLAPGTAVQLTLRPPLALRPLVLQATVVWYRQWGNDPGMGLAFVESDPQQTERLRKVLDKALRKAQEKKPE